MSFVKATRKQVKLKIALTGPSGSGKTFSSLMLAQGIGKKIALVDTENESASLYADRFEFDTDVISPPYTIQKYTAAIQAAQKAGYDVLVIDSLTHAWAGDGGLLAKKALKDASGKGNSYTNWNGLTQEQEQFVSAILNANIHLICTIRSKQDYILQETDKGKQAPKKVGMAPIQREGMEYEFTTVFDIDMNHKASASKDRTGLWGDEIFSITPETGEKFMKWLNAGAAQKIPVNVTGKVIEQTKQERSGVVDAAILPEVTGPVTDSAQSASLTKDQQPEISRDQIIRLFTIASANNWTQDQVKDFMMLAFHVDSTKLLTKRNYDVLCRTLEISDFATAVKNLGV